MKEEIIIGDFKNTGINKIDIEFVVTHWNYRWFLTEWNDNTWRIIKMKRIYGKTTDINTSISFKQVTELIERLDLICEKGLSTSSKIYRRGIDWEYVEKYTDKKNNKK